MVRCREEVNKALGMNDLGRNRANNFLEQTLEGEENPQEIQYLMTR